MPRASQQLLSAAEAAQVDRVSIADRLMPSPVLMERAAVAVARTAMEVGAADTDEVCCLCGPGNNGADGVAVARILAGYGVTSRVVLADGAASEALQAQLRLAREHGVPIQPVAQAPRPGGSAMVIDALLGTGAAGPLREPIVDVLAFAARACGPRLAVDVPTGVDPDGGGVQEGAFVAQHTVTFGRSKPGLHLTPGRDHAGFVVVANIGLFVEPGRRAWELMDPQAAARWLAGPAPAHKGERGHVAVWGGSAGMGGAAVLAATAAARAGAGVLTLFSHDEALRAQVLKAHPAFMTGDPGQTPFAAGAGAVIVGPGLVDAQAHGDALQRVYEEDERPVVVDASALGVLDVTAQAAGPRVLTPHPGEAAALLCRITGDPNWTSARVQQDRAAALAAACERTSAVVVLKGAGTVAGLGALRRICTAGSQALATAGSGDVLAGILGAFLARAARSEADPAAVLEAVQAAVLVHAASGELGGAAHPRPVAGEIADAVAAACEPTALLAHTPWPTLLLA